MGIAGLWDVLKPAAVKRSMLELPVSEGFEKNPKNLRGFRIGIDASIWFFHAEYGKEGENPELRTLFFRCATLMHAPWLPLFVFDGPKRPSWKRGKRISKNNHALINGMKGIVEAFGYEWRMAPGEAEAELAYLNRIGIIDGVLSDDSDNFLFGALTVIRNPSNNLSANRAKPVLNSEGRDDKQHTMVYRLADITSQLELTRGGLILIGLMAGGDYEQAGLPDCGIKVATGLARCGFGDTLYDAANTLDDDALEDFLENWRNELRHELRTNAQGKLPSKRKKLADALPESFPSIKVLRSYTCPITTESMGREENNLKITWGKDPNMAALARTCEMHFEWGFKDIIVKRFRTVVWPGAILRILRRAVLDADARRARLGVPSTPRKHRGREDEDEGAPGSPSKLVAKYLSGLTLDSPGARDHSDSDSDDEDKDDMVLKIHSSRTHASTDGMLEYRLEVAPRALVRAAESGVLGTRRPMDEDEWSADSDSGEDFDSDGEPAKRVKGAKGTKKAPPAPESTLRVWVPAVMVRMTHPRMVREFEEKQAAKRAKGKGKASTAAARKARAPAISEEEEEEDDDVAPAPASSKGKKADAAKPAPLRSRTNSSQLSRASSGQMSRTGTSLLDDLDALSSSAKLKRAAKRPANATSRPKPASQTSKPRAPATLPLFEEEESPPRPPARPPRRMTLDSDDDSDDELPSNVLSKLKGPSRAASKQPAPPPKLKYVSISSSDEEDDGFLPDPGDVFSSPSKASSSRASAPSRSSRKNTAPSSDPDSDVVTVNKSPRRSREHSSPRKRRPTRRTSPSSPVRRLSPLPSRAPSPSPIRKRPTASTKMADVSIIELTSDEGTPAKPPPPKTGMSSLQAARLRIQARTGEGMAQRTMLDFARTKKSTTVKTGGKQTYNAAPGTVIDLTI
uniref:XPG-I domain-containing protein n=1 Tax=Schizophyllum commune (strain H4-8 / FGSC 9210) TaxID=578458 RepID=D8QFX1_SCHCM